MTARLLALLLLLAPLPAAAEIVLPTGFSTHVYVTGEGFDTDSGRGTRGIPSTSTIAFDGTGALNLARTGRRYGGGEAYDLWPTTRARSGSRATARPRLRFSRGRAKSFGSTPRGRRASCTADPWWPRSA